MEMIKVLLFFNLDPMPLSKRLADYVFTTHGQPPTLPLRYGAGDYTAMEKIMAINASDPLKVAPSGKVMMEFVQKRRREDQEPEAAPPSEPEPVVIDSS